MGDHISRTALSIVAASSLAACAVVLMIVASPASQIVLIGAMPGALALGWAVCSGQTSPFRLALIGWAWALSVCLAFTMALFLTASG
ncbi:MAG: hypothetical protein AB7N24_16925 [Dehalococcoidia bacterium]